MDFQDLLDALDINRNNLLEETEYRNKIIVNTIDEKNPHGEPDPVFIMLDADEDGEISFEEVLEFIDMDQDGIIEPEEYNNFIKSLP